jgi:hypothetical protein
MRLLVPSLADGFVGDVQHRRDFDGADVAGLVQMRENLLLSFLREHGNPLTKKSTHVKQILDISGNNWIFAYLRNTSIDVNTIGYNKMANAAGNYYLLGSNGSTVITSFNGITINHIPDDLITYAKL